MFGCRLAAGATPLMFCVRDRPRAALLVEFLCTTSLTDECELVLLVWTNGFRNRYGQARVAPHRGPVF